MREAVVDVLEGGQMKDTLVYNYQKKILCKDSHKLNPTFFGLNI